MVKDWRELFQDKELPFYYVQLPRFKRDPWYHFRNVQREISRSLPHSFMAITIDIPMDYELNRTYEESVVYDAAHPDTLTERNVHPIHPLIKAPIGERLAMGAKALVYGIKGDGEYTGPMIESAVLENDKIRLSFKFTSDKLKSIDKMPLRGFFVSGPDQKFVKAEADIDGKSILLHSFGVLQAKTVRYGAEEDIPQNSTLNLNLVNQQNLPTSPFTEEIVNESKN